MATSANMDWTQTGPGNTGYPPAFRSGNMNPAGPSHEADVSYILRDDVHNSNNPRPQYAPSGGYHSHGAHFSPTLHAGLHASGPSIEEHFWPHQNDPAQNESQANEPAHGETAYDEPAEPTNEPNSNDDEAPDPNGPTRPQKTTIPRSERRKHYKPKPDPSNPRLFRPFDNLETLDTTLPQWRLPPIVGSYVMFPNKKLKHNPMPSDVDAVREKLFKMDQSILFKNSQEVADYVPHVTNYWRRAVQRHEVDEQTGLQVEYWHCRSKKVKRPPRRPEHVSKGIRNREKKSVVLFEDQELCRMRIRVTSFTKHANTPGEHERWGGGACKCVAEWVHFEKACIEGTPTEHTHGQEIMDTWKRSEAVAVLAKVKCEEGNSYAAVSKWLRKEFGDHSKQVYKFEKGDVANAAQKWRNDHKDLVLREEVPEDSEEMTTMRHCVDAILEADADALRAALRQVIKDSDALTQSALAILTEKKPDAPAEEVPKEPWELAEGISVLDLPFPGATQKLRDASGVHGPPRTPLPHWRRYVPPPPPQPAPQQAVQPARGSPPKVGPDGRPIPSFGVLTPGTMAASQGDPRVQDRQQHMYHQTSSPGAVNAPPTRGVALQPRPTVPTYGAPSQPGAQPPTRVEIRYVYPPAPPPPPPQKGCVHPITFSMEVPSCPLDTCKQCRHMRRGTAGRTFYFQDKLHTTAHFTKLQNLLRDPMQLLDDDYTRVLHQSAVASVHPHPALHTEVPQRSSLHRPPPPEGQRAPAPDMRHVQHMPPSPTGHVHVQGHQQGQPRPTAASAPTQAGAELNTSPGKADANAQHTPQSAAASIYDQALPVPITIEDEDNDDNDDHNGREDNVEGNGIVNEREEDNVERNGNNIEGEGEEEEDDDDDEQPPAKRQKQGSPEAEE